MTEQELKDKAEIFFIEKNYLHSGLADRPRIINWMAEFAKSEVEKAVAAKDKKIAEIRRLCKAFLHDLPCSHNVSVIGEFLDAYADNKILDEFKKSVVASKDAELKSWKEAHDNLVMQLTIQSDEVERLAEGIAATAESIQNDIERGTMNEYGYLVAKTAKDRLEGLLSPADEPKPLDSPAPVTDASKWISVNKSLPERGQAVLVCMKSGAITIAYLKLNIQVWQVFGDLNASFDPFDEIHHWMPLPLQPEPREN